MCSCVYSIAHLKDTICYSRLKIVDELDYITNAVGENILLMLNKHFYYRLKNIDKLDYIKNLSDLTFFICFIKIFDLKTIDELDCRTNVNDQTSYLCLINIFIIVWKTLKERDYFRTNVNDQTSYICFINKTFWLSFENVWWTWLQNECSSFGLARGLVRPM
jgi:hypothetical protein